MGRDGEHFTAIKSVYNCDWGRGGGGDLHNKEEICCEKTTGNFVVLFIFLFLIFLLSLVKGKQTIKCYGTLVFFLLKSISLLNKT